jgi:hypothetical protein
VLKRNRWLLYLLTLLILIPVYAEETALEINLQAVDKDTPSFKRAVEKELGSEYQLKMVKIKNYSQITVPPNTEAAVLYYGEIKLGSPVQTYGILVDFEGKDKVLWVDSNGDGDFSQETPYQIFKSDRYPGVNVYYSPEPIVFQVTYSVAGQAFKLPLQFELPYLLISRVGHADHFFLRTRPWLTGSVDDNGEEIRVAVVDANDNGNYNDPEDLFFVDQNYDLNFDIKESKELKKVKTIKLKSKNRYQTDFQFLPQKIILVGER